MKSQNYNLDSNLKNNKDEDIISFFLSPFFSISCFLAFIQSAYNTDEIFCQLFLTFPVYQACIKDSGNKLQKEHSNLFD